MISAFIIVVWLILLLQIESELKGRWLMPICAVIHVASLALMIWVNLA